MLIEAAQTEFTFPGHTSNHTNNRMEEFKGESPPERGIHRVLPLFPSQYLPKIGVMDRLPLASDMLRSDDLAWFGGGGGGWVHPTEGKFVAAGTLLNGPFETGRVRYGANTTKRGDRLNGPLRHQYGDVRRSCIKRPMLVEHQTHC